MDFMHFWLGSSETRPWRWKDLTHAKSRAPFSCPFQLSLQFLGLLPRSVWELIQGLSFNSHGIVVYDQRASHMPASEPSLHLRLHWLRPVLTILRTTVSTFALYHFYRTRALRSFPCFWNLLILRWRSNSVSEYNYVWWDWTIYFDLSAEAHDAKLKWALRPSVRWSPDADPSPQ
jgi:hypothetical protein